MGKNRINVFEGYLGGRINRTGLVSGYGGSGRKIVKSSGIIRLN